MRIYSINNLYGKFIHKNYKRKRIVQNTVLGLALCTASFAAVSCSKDYEPVIIHPKTLNPDSIHYSGDLVLPDTVSQPNLQDIKDINEKINTVFTSLNIIDKNKKIQDIKSVEFEDAQGNEYKFTDIKSTNKGFEFNGKVIHNGIEEKAGLRFSDANDIINRPLVSMETTFNKKHNLSMIYQNRWRMGKDGKPERRLFQNRTSIYVESINPKDYYPYDSYNIFALRKTENGVSSKVIQENSSHSENDEIKNIKVVYK